MASKACMDCAVRTPPLPTLPFQTPWHAPCHDPHRPGVRIAAGGPRQCTQRGPPALCWRRIGTAPTWLHACCRQRAQHARLAHAVEARHRRCAPWSGAALRIAAPRLPAHALACMPAYTPACSAAAARAARPWRWHAAQCGRRIASPAGARLGRPCGQLQPVLRLMPAGAGSWVAAAGVPHALTPRSPARNSLCRGRRRGGGQTKWGRTCTHPRRYLAALSPECAPAASRRGREAAVQRCSGT
eukprot:358855-Chlamydomonas_euryale.AAC.8